MVSVFMLVYNQEQLIEQTIESILNQKTNFPFNLVIGEDCSIDRTKEILEKYKKKLSSQIKIITSSQNVGLINNFIRTVNQCDGKYIAICDGDDFWTDENKLQMQVDFLESNPDYSIVFTRKRDLLPDGKISIYQAVSPVVSSFSDLVKRNYIPSVTALFRNKVQGQLPLKWLNKYPYGDWVLYLYTVNNGSKIKFMDTITATYRKNIGVSAKIRQSASQVVLDNLNILKDLYNDSIFKNNRPLIKKSILEHEVDYMKRLNDERKFLKAFIMFFCLLANINPIKLTRQYLFSIKKQLL
ncbi:glycosyltransferase [Yeosuana aromativorans]|nr:glycosyltransferase [Yeosuana aromativorans]